MINDFLNSLSQWGISIGSPAVIFIAFVIFIRVILWLIGAAGVYKLSKKEKLKNQALCFVPFIQSLSFGKVAEKCKNQAALKATKYGGWLFFLSLASAITFTAFFLYGAVSFTTITRFALKAIELDNSMTLDMFTSAIYAICFYFTALVAYLCYFVLYRVAFWQVLKKYNSKNAVLFIIISILFPFLTPVLIFSIKTEIKEGNSTPSEPIGFYF